MIAENHTGLDVDVRHFIGEQRWAEAGTHLRGIFHVPCPTTHLPTFFHFLTRHYRVFFIQDSNNYVCARFFTPTSSWCFLHCQRLRNILFPKHFFLACQSIHSSSLSLNSAHTSAVFFSFCDTVIVIGFKL